MTGGPIVLAEKILQSRHVNQQQSIRLQMFQRGFKERFWLLDMFNYVEEEHHVICVEQRLMLLENVVVHYSSSTRIMLLEGLQVQIGAVNGPFGIIFDLARKHAG